ncbi:exodeoxyribonuclease III [Aliarcobacter butzleri]|uniref:exodeoxyribonuclease III n=1 Tax=Aliarcobacter butzleri TaxID=28197 RepID=UPI001EDF8CC8|nr:exodeoxyribonuclease III [Aliarcobacter butzleri]MCG3674780.1 exodeoxyribonuclease III [Aliarcobacter butzleri]MCG3697390.1 exodeoxyribonuclease III [Aliarcobacter butzleri]MCG3699088.1 exodeoxyribonuclease III [Aliarcobacter butzleri]MCT7619813.1 exodeoxyribonuclease III [Aliarcobacter butzleri]MDN5080094.1 exodeoxyribonuclease III [Aliarcobacter butzleri]
MAKRYKFISWNVNGIRAVDKKDALKWIDESEVDLLGVQETKSMKDQIPKTIFSKEFKTLFASASAIKGRSGTALFSDIEPTFQSICESVDILDEGRINEVHFNLADKNIAFFNVYFPNGQSSQERLDYKMEFYDRFLNHCENLKKDGKSIIVCGDVNTAHTEIDIARPKANENTSGFLQMERDWITKFLSHGYIDTFRLINGDIKDKYSWWSYRANARANNVGWRIDYFYVSSDLKDYVKDAYILDKIEGSDHCPIGLEMEF